MLIPYSTCSEIIRSVHNLTPRKIIHIGAHIGEEVDSYQENGAEQIIWFEANANLIQKLELNLQKNIIKQQIVPIALWNENTELTFKVTNNFQSSSFFELRTHSEHYPDIKVIEEQKIKAYRLDHLLNANPNILIFSDFEFINIDTQGAELAILEGMGRYLVQPSVKAIYLEVNREELYKEIPLVSDIDRFLSTHQFARVTTKWTPQGWGDALYLRCFESA